MEFAELTTICISNWLLLLLCTAILDPMDLLLFHRDQYEQLYSCSYMNASEWAKEGSPNVPLGILYIVIGTTFISLYMLCIRVMCTKQLRQHSCLKIMIQIGITDMANLVANCVYTGYLTMIGAVFCTSPLQQYFAGSYIMFIWCTCSLTSVLLSLNRALELMFPKRMYFLFGGWRVYAWLIFPWIYGLYFGIYTPSPSFSTKVYAWFFDPYFGMDQLQIDRTYYSSPPHSYHNIGTSIVFSILYAIHFGTLWWKTRFSTSENMGKTRKRLFIQSFLISTINFSACVCYVLIEHIMPPKIIILIAHFLWICCNCGPVIIYLVVNKTIQAEFIRTFIPRNFHSRMIAPTSMTSPPEKSRAKSSTT
uniref:G_PROTEIN_RECEP_F1_2 domain-containing protein n=1 Tax=Steinernema glaseri TaxID=37863 RepID=A0A1I8AVU6_9BILA